MRFRMAQGYGTTYLNDILINYSNPSQVGYGGTLEVETGLLTVTSIFHEFDGTESFTRIGTSGTYAFRYVPSTSIHFVATGNKRASSHFANTTITTSNTNIGYYAYELVGSSSSYGVMQFRHLICNWSF